jgi:hypothetical protein
MSGHRAIRLLLADVDGTLVTHDKVLTDAAKEAVRIRWPTRGQWWTPYPNFSTSRLSRSPRSETCRMTF